jgi:hypothetical protein
MDVAAKAPIPPYPKALPDKNKNLDWCLEPEGLIFASKEQAGPHIMRQWGPPVSPIINDNVIKEISMGPSFRVKSHAWGLK